MHITGIHTVGGIHGLASILILRFPTITSIAILCEGLATLVNEGLIGVRPDVGEFNVCHYSNIKIFADSIKND